MRKKEQRGRRGAGGDAVGGGKPEIKGKQSDRKFSPGQTNKNSRLACSIFFFFFRFFVMNVSRPLFSQKTPRPRTPLPLCPSPKTIPIKLKPLQTKRNIPCSPSLFPTVSPMTNNITHYTKAHIYSLLSYNTVFPHWRKENK